MKKNINVLIFAKSIDGGTGTFVTSFLNINKIQSATRIKTRVVCLETPSYRNLNKNKFVFFRGNKFYPEKYNISLKNIYNFFCELMWFRDRLKEFNPDIIIGVDVHCNLLIQLEKYSFKFKANTILTTHIDLEQTLYDKSTILTKILLKKLVTFFYDKADYLVCVSKELAKNVQTNFNLKSHVIPIYNGNPPIPSKYYNPNRTLPPEHKRNILISVARLTKQKDHETLIKAFSLAEKEMPNVELWILSDGPERKNLVKLMRKLKLSKKIKFFGWVKNIYPYINSAQIFVLSSRREGFAYCLIEAMAQGIPVISTDTAYGPSEVLDGGKYGILTSVGNINELKNAIISLLKNSQKYHRFSKLSFERSKYFSEDKMLKEYGKLISKIWSKQK